jgi:predicted enzyme related to lactoylglutathione lyase
MACQAPEQVGLVSTFGVESVGDAVTRVGELAGQVVVPKQAVSGIGWLARFLDTEGNLFPVWRSDESAARGHVSGAVQLDASANV